MAEPAVLDGTYVTIAVETTPDSGTFVPICGIVTRSLAQQINTRDRFIRDCAVPGSVPIRRVIATGSQWSVSGGGLVNRNQFAAIREIYAAAKGNSRRKYRFIFDEPADDEIVGFAGYFEGSGLMTQMNINGNDDDDSGLDLTIEGDGDLEWVDA